MLFHPLPLKGAYLIDLNKQGDDRGFFARFFCQKEFKDLGIDINVTQVNNSLSKDKGTLRGLHYQLPPKQEDKIVRCLSGSIYDVIIDLRPESPTFKQHYGATLSAENRTMMLVPKGFAHAFLTLEKNTEVIYLVTETYSPELERGIRWNDPEFNIQWPIPPAIISDKDQQHPNFSLSYHLNQQLTTV